MYKHHGIRHPIIVDKDRQVIAAGHGRKLAAIREGLKEFPVVYQKFETEEDLYTFCQADNALSLESELDLAGINEDIGDLGPFDLDKLGIPDFAVDVADRFEDKDADEVPEDVEPIAKLGQIYQLGEHRLMCGDSTDEQTVSLLMNGEKADMVFTDPPYGVDYEGISNDSRSGLDDLLDKSFANYIKSMKQGGSVYCFHSDKCADIFHNIFRKYFHFSSMIIWVKPSLVMGQSDYQSKHEPCLYGWEKSAKHFWYSDRKQVSVWEYGRENLKEHTTPKPTEMIIKALNNSSMVRNLVLDLFGGSGSTLIACEKTNRKCYMMELDPYYVDVIIARWEKFTDKKAVLLNG
jgi:site-specific DNA-methyltransferase (adenine-specific)